MRPRPHFCQKPCKQHGKGMVKMVFHSSLKSGGPACRLKAFLQSVGAESPDCHGGSPKQCPHGHDV